MSPDRVVYGAAGFAGRVGIVTFGLVVFGSALARLVVVAVQAAAVVAVVAAVVLVVGRWLLVRYRGW